MADQSFKPKTTKKPAFRGKVQINPEQCKGCGFCVEFCPKKVLKLSSEFNSKGHHPPIVIDSSSCAGCNLCGLFCPDFAIYGWREREKDK